MLRSKLTKVLVLMISLIGFLVIGKEVYAASSSISTSSNSVKAGDTITVTISANAASWNVNLNADGPVTALGTTSFSNASESGDNENVVVGTVTYKANAEGTVNFNLTGQLVDGNYQPTNASGNAKVAISAQSNTNTSTNQTTTTTQTTQTTKTQSEPEAKFTDTNKTMYSTGDVNVRSSYSTSSKAVGSLKEGDTVTVIGTSSNGWSKVKFNGQTAYVKTSLLTDKKPEKKSNNNFLKSLKIDGVSLNPEFNKETTEYKITVGNDVESLKIDARSRR